MAEDETFLRRWSARKAKVREEEAREVPVADEDGAVAGDVPAVQPEAGDDAPAEASLDDLPDIDSLDAESDYTGFLRKGVPEELQRRALRKLWLSDPVLANVDGLVDYGEDFTGATKVMPGLKTAYRIGKGFVRDAEEEVAEEEVAQEGGAGEKAAGDKVAGDKVAEETADDAGDAPVDDTGSPPAETPAQLAEAVEDEFAEDGAAVPDRNPVKPE